MAGRRISEHHAADRIRLKDILTGVSEDPPQARRNAGIGGLEPEILKAKKTREQG